MGIVPTSISFGDVYWRYRAYFSSIKADSF